MINYSYANTFIMYYYKRREARGEAHHQRHTNGVVSNNNTYSSFGFGGIKRAF